MATEHKAAELPALSIVATDKVAFIKNYPTAYCEWRGTTGGYYSNDLVQAMLESNATVLRVGAP